MKSEIKVEFSNTIQLKNLIESAYFEEGQMGKIIGKNHFLEIGQDDSENYKIFKELDGSIAKVTNNDIIDGSIRFMVGFESDNIKLKPVSIYCVKEDNKYIFY